MSSAEGGFPPKSERARHIVVRDLAGAIFIVDSDRSSQRCGEKPV